MARNKDKIDLGNPLGLSGTPVEPDPTIHSEDDEASRRRRRERALGEDGLDGNSTTKTGMGDVNVDPDGAAGTDMGYGGEGTDIKPSR